MERPPVVRTGEWTDYDQNFGSKRQRTVSDLEYGLWQLMIGVLVGAAWPWISELLLRIWHWIKYWRSNKQRPHDTELLKERTGLRKWVFSPLAFSTAVGVTYAFGSAFITQVPADTSALTVSDACGLWTLRENPGPRAQDMEDLRQATKERTVAQYGRDCYGDRSATSPDSCNFFEKDAIPYIVDRGIECPFEDPDFCEEPSGSVKFSTGTSKKSNRIEASFIGINSPRPPKFSRVTTCAPLNMTKPPKHYIKRIEADAWNLYPRYAYDLGPVGGSRHQDEYTFRTLGFAFKWDMPGYSLSVYEAPGDGYWTPRKELNHPKDTSLTIMFIQSCRVFYKESSQDLIFPADLPYDPINWPGLYFNTDPRARPLACVDKSEVCNHDESVCLSPSEPTPPQLRGREGEEYEFVRLALAKSTTYQSIQYGLGSALNASLRIADFVSKRLPDASDGGWSQWMVESQGLYNTSLARIQFDALDIAMGVSSDKGDLYQPVAADWADLCGKFKFKLPKGYKNLGKWATFWALSIPALLFVLHLKLWIKFDENMEPFFNGNWMVLDFIFIRLPLQLRDWNRRRDQSPRPKPSPLAASAQQDSDQLSGVREPLLQAQNSQTSRASESRLSGSLDPEAQTGASPSHRHAPSVAADNFSLGTSGSITPRSQDVTENPAP